MAAPNSATPRQQVRNAVIRQWDIDGTLDTFVARRALPTIEVLFSSGEIRRIPRESYNQNKDPRRANDGGYNKVAFTDETLKWNTQEYGLEAPVDERHRKQVSDYDALLEATRLVMFNVLLQQERRAAAAMFNATVFSSYTSSVTTEWSTTATATPITDVKTAAQSIRKNCGLAPNKLLISGTAWNNLSESTQILNRINGGATTDMPAKVMRAMVAELMGLDEVLVAGAVHSSANDGQAHVGAEIWDDEYALLYYQKPNPRINDLTLGGTLHWGEDGSQPDGRVEEYFDTTKRCNVVRCRHEVDEKIMYPECGWLLDNITA